MSLLNSIVLLVLSLPGAVALAQDAHPDSRPATLPATAPASVEQWDIFELALNGPADGNPFDVKLSARFTPAAGGDAGGDATEAHGFYDGGGVYRVRFMPPRQGTWRYETASDRPQLSGKTGEFTCVKPSAANHGPVVVHNTYHFAYADGTPFFPISTTLYGWVQQRSEELQEQTLATLRASPFNRVRMMVLPISYGPDNVPPFFPFERNGLVMRAFSPHLRSLNDPARSRAIPR